jgi:hypothetical protein
MRPEDIIADYLRLKGLVILGRDGPDDIARGIIEALEREGLAIDYPMEWC